MIVFTILTLLIVALTFTSTFGFKPSKSLEDWADTATVITGIASPFLTAISVFLLYYVWKDNRKELKETKKVLTEQSDTQNFSVIKDAVFEIADQLHSTLQEKYTYGLSSKKWVVVSDDNSFHPSYDKDSIGKEQRWDTSLEQLINYHFIHTKGDDSFTKDFKGTIFGTARIQVSEQIKIVSLFIRALKSPEYRLILETTLFSKFKFFTWLMFIEISYEQFQNAREEDKDYAELVFLEIAGLTCRQAKNNSWIKSLSDEVLVELEARKLL